MTAPSLDPRPAGWLAPVAVAAIVALALPSGGPEPTGEDAPATEFSTARAYRHLRVIAAAPHPTGTPENDRVHDYLVEQLARLGAEVHDVRTARPGHGFDLRNVAARRRGTGSTGAVLVSAHYDSRTGAPGAGDNGAAVASALETLRALGEGPLLRNDVIFLFTDGEEVGLLGARAFVESHPWRGDVGVVLNFDARGNAGPMLMYETSRAAGELVRHYAEAVEHPVAASLMADVYALMPNATDFTVLARAGYPGLNFAFIGGYGAYHQPTDTVDSLDPRTLTHQGTSMLALVRRFGDLPLPVAKSGDAVYFNPVGSWLVRYPAALVWPLTAAALALLALVIGAGARAGRVRPRRVAAGAVVCALAALASTAAGAALTGGALLAVHGAWSIVGHTAADPLFFAAITLGAAAVTCLSLRRASRSCRADELALGAVAAWCVLLLSASVWLPGGTGPLLWALLPCLLALGSGYLGRGSASAPRVGVYLACAAVTLALVSPLVHLFYQAMLLGLAAAALPLVALTVALLWPVLHGVSGRLAAVAAALAAVLWIAGWVAS